MRYIYVLKDPNNNEIRYVGQTNNIQKRYNDHISSSLNENNTKYNTHKSNWVRKIINNGNKPIIEIIDECETLNESNKLERYYIEKYYEEGCKLTNSYINDVTEFSVETRKKMSDAKKGKSLEDIHGVDKANELKEKFIKRTIEYNKKPKTDETKSKISETLKEHFKDKENHWAYGKIMTEDHNDKLRKAKLNNPNNVGNRTPRTEEQKENLRNKIKGTTIKRYKILQYTLDMVFIKEWNNIREIHRNDTTLSRKKIAECCKGNINYYAEFIWKYKEDDVI